MTTGPDYEPEDLEVAPTPREPPPEPDEGQDDGS